MVQTIPNHKIRPCYLRRHTCAQRCQSSLERTGKRIQNELQAGDQSLPVTGSSVGERLKESADCQLKSFLRLLSVAYDRWGYFFWLLVGRLVNRIVLLSSLLVKILSERGFACCGRPVLLLGFSPWGCSFEGIQGHLEKAAVNTSILQWMCPFI